MSYKQNMTRIKRPKMTPRDKMSHLNNCRERNIREVVFLMWTKRLFTGTIIWVVIGESPFKYKIDLVFRSSPGKGGVIFSQNIYNYNFISQHIIDKFW